MEFLGTILLGVIGPFTQERDQYDRYILFPRITGQWTADHCFSLSEATFCYLDLIEELDTDGKVRKILEPYVRSLYLWLLESQGHSPLARGVIGNYTVAHDDQGRYGLVLGNFYIEDLKRDILNHLSMIVYCLLLDRLGHCDVRESYAEVRDILDRFPDDQGNNTVLDGLVDYTKDISPLVLMGIVFTYLNQSGWDISTSEAMDRYIEASAV